MRRFSLLAYPTLLLAAFSAAQDSDAPTAVLDAPDALLPGEALFLYGGRSSDAHGRLVRYEWVRTAGPSAADPQLNVVVETREPVLSTGQLSARTLPPGLHRFELRVVDSSGNVSAPDAAEVRVVDNIAPVAVLDGPGAVDEGAGLILHGHRSSDVGGRVIRYRWLRLGGSPVETASTRFTNPEVLPPGTYTFQLVVLDDSGNASLPARRQVVVRGPDTDPPVAVLVAPASVPFGRAFTLAGTGSKDARGEIVLYEWTRMSGRGGDLAVGKPAQTSSSSLQIRQPAADPMQPGRHVFRLVVVDDAGNRSRPADRSVFVAKPRTRRR